MRMSKDEFKHKKEMIESLLNDASVERPNINQNFKSLDVNIRKLVKAIDTRNTSLNKYLNEVSDLQFADSLSTPLEQFSGIRTAADMADPIKMKAKGEEMRKYAMEIDSSTKTIDLSSQSTLLALKRLISLVSEYVKQNNNVYDNYLEVLDDMDSHYDVSHLGN